MKRLLTPRFCAMPTSAHTPRRHWLLHSLWLAAGVTAWAPALAQSPAAEAWPNKPVTLVTAFAPGSGPDAVLRLVADKLAKTWNQRVVVDNKPGGGGFLAIDAVKRAPADGYTLLQLDSEHLSALPLLYKSRNFDTLKTFEPVGILFRTPFMLAVSSNAPWKTVAELVEAAKAKPGSLSFGSWGVGSPGHLGGEELELRSGIDMQHIPYRDVGQLFSSVASGDVGWSFASIPSSQGAYKTGKLRYLAVAASKRIVQLPDVPTLAEAGGPALEVNSFVVLLAPRGVPTAVRDKVHADVHKAVNEPDIKARFDSFAFEILPWGPADIERQAQIKARVYAELVKRKAISLE